MMFYRNHNGFESVVHSAGRHLNSNEKISSKFMKVILNVFITMILPFNSHFLGAKLIIKRIQFY